MREPTHTRCPLSAIALPTHTISEHKLIHTTAQGEVKDLRGVSAHTFATALVFYMSSRARGDPKVWEKEEDTGASVS